MTEMLLTHLLEAVAALLLAAGIIAMRHLADWLKLRADSEVRGYLNEALAKAVEFGLAQARHQLLSEGSLVESDAARERLLGRAAAIAEGYAKDRVPDALKRFGIDGAGLGAMIRARLPPSAG